MAIRVLKALKHSLRSNFKFEEFATALQDYFDANHGKLVPKIDLKKLPEEVYYHPMHAMRKESSVSKIHVIFIASAKTASGTSLNNHFLIRPTFHPLWWAYYYILETIQLP